MTTLRIDHEIHTYDLWEEALGGYVDVLPRVFATLCSAANPPPTFQHRCSVSMGAQDCPRP
jgi:hypothetical protein